MSDWQQTLKDQSIATLEKLAEKFGAENIDVEALRPAFDNFQMRLTPAVLEQIKEVGDPMWQQYVPTVEELDIQDGMIDSLDEDGDSPVPNITHRYPDRALFLVSPVCATYCRFCTRRRKVSKGRKRAPVRHAPTAAPLCRHPRLGPAQGGARVDPAQGDAQGARGAEEDYRRSPGRRPPSPATPRCTSVATAASAVAARISVA